jgi:hypothetical protein
MASIIGFFDGNTLRAASLEGLLLKNKTKHWQMKHGAVAMPFPDILQCFEDKYIRVMMLCVASKHVPLVMTTIVRPHTNPPTMGNIMIRMSGVNVHSVDFDGVFSRTKDGRWSLKDSYGSDMPLGLALQKAESRLVEMEIEGLYPLMPSILDCKKRVLYP